MEPLDISGLDDDIVNMKLQMVLEDGSSVVYWAGTQTDWLMDGPAIMMSLAMATKIVKDRFMNEGSGD